MDIGLYFVHKEGDFNSTSSYAWCSKVSFNLHNYDDSNVNLNLDVGAGYIKSMVGAIVFAQ